VAGWRRWQARSGGARALSDVVAWQQCLQAKATNRRQQAARRCPHTSLLEEGFGRAAWENMWRAGGAEGDVFGA